MKDVKIGYSGLSERYYVSRMGKCSYEYLHVDGIWRDSTMHEGYLTGYFDTKAAALHAFFKATTIGLRERLNNG